MLVGNSSTTTSNHMVCACLYAMSFDVVNFSRFAAYIIRINQNTRNLLNLVNFCFKIRNMCADRWAGAAGRAGQRRDSGGTPAGQRRDTAGHRRDTGGTLAGHRRDTGGTPAEHRFRTQPLIFDRTTHHGLKSKKSISIQFSHSNHMKPTLINHIC